MKKSVDCTRIENGALWQLTGMVLQKCSDLAIRYYRQTIEKEDYGRMLPEVQQNLAGGFV